MIYPIEKVTALIGAHRFGEQQGIISFLLIDSRSLCFPEETLFFALRTERNDGHRYIPELYNRGVRSFVVEQLPDRWQERYPQANFLRVPDTLKALQRLAERHRDEFQIPIVGITGSNGKTVVKEWIYQLLLPSHAVTRSPRSFNSQIGVPLSVWLMNEHTRIGLFEAGISEPHEMQALRDIIQPTIGVFTNLGSAHQENFSSMREKCLEKMRLFQDAKTIVYPADDVTIAEVIATECQPGAHYGRYDHTERVACKVLDRKVVGDKVQVSVSFRYEQQGTETLFDYTLPFIDEASVRNSMLCAATCVQLGLTLDVIRERLLRLEPVAMRLEVKPGINDCTLINDSYNNDLDSLVIALDFMNRRPDCEGRKRTLILSDIFQSGLQPEQLYKIISEIITKGGVEKFIGIGKEITARRDDIAIPEKYFFEQTADFLNSELFRQLHSEVILLKGARRYGFEVITDQLVQKVHETILEVNLNAVVQNLNYFRSFLKPETKMVCMVKADAYGSGAVEVAKTLQDHRVDYLAVAVADEGVTLRQNGITSNIMIMNPEMTAFKTMFDHELEPEVYSFRLMDALIKAARKEGITGYPVHIKIDTGMHRLGFDPEKDIDEVINRLNNQNAIIPRSVFTHFVGADSDDFDNFSAMQFERFDKASKKLQSAFSHHILRHISNSAGIEHFPERQLDMCRLGIGLYGVDSRDNRILHNVCTLKTTILQMRRVPKDETVGYSRKGILQRDSVIAAIPIGYADGLNRHLGRGRGYCLVNGQKAPYVGNICMDVAMIDVTDINCHEGDTVEIFGDHLPVTVLSDLLDTIPYEILTGVSNRVKRVHFLD
ncbi:MAG: bifunctional UDP-N-acetylmuramoyl-tripeptide:D-alanyl-D-alanine ligase/alanine racemase [Prevotella sp.]|nr:bifunctional UDP-N-acetylmuramoyl-tripeptide:D-alanyl-D-alanine ligase/alanine racemase [Prevotella sp.]